jgi:hypothetical protein
MFLFLPVSMCSHEADDFGLAPAEVSQTMQRLFAIPTAAYTNAYGEASADMRPALPTFTFGPQDGGVMKLAMPTFALSQTSGSSSLGGTHHKAIGGSQEEHKVKKIAMASKWLKLAQKSATGAPAHTEAALSAEKDEAAAALKQQPPASSGAARMQALSRASSLTASALASVEGDRVKALAQARLKKKHNILSGMKQEHTDAVDAGPSQHGRKKAADLDSQISGSGKWLQKAVMTLAVIAGSCIFAGICGE